jgi:glycosyltransferase involved in cell wall biosynthesis
LKILVTTFTFTPNRDGVAEATAVLANGLAVRGYCVTVATAYHPERNFNQPRANLQVEQFKISDNDGTVDERQRYLNFVTNFDCDVMIFECWDTWNTSLIEPHLHRLKSKKILISHGYTAHQWVPYPKFAWGLGGWAKRMPKVLALPFSLRRYDHVTFLSHRAAWDRFLDHWVAKMTGFSRYSIIPNGAFRKEFEESTLDFRAQYGIGSGPMLLCVANYCDRKNQKLALRAFRRAGLPDTTLVFIGSEFNKYSSELLELDKTEKSQFPAGQVLFLEKVSRAMTCAAYRAADLFVLSAKAETQPIVLLEAMASHTAFVSTDTGCVAELPGGVVVRSEQEMTAQLRQLVNTPRTREKLAEEGWVACKSTYDWERVIESYVSLLSKVTDNPKQKQLACKVA